MDMESNHYGTWAGSGLLNDTGRRHRAHRDRCRERAAESTHLFIYRRPSRPLGHGLSRAALRAAGEENPGAVEDIVTASDF